MTPPASSTRTYRTSLWVELPPSIRPETDDDTLPPTPPTPPNRSSKWPDQYGSAMKPTQAATMTANRTGRPRSSLRPTRTSAASTPSITNGVSWWAGTRRREQTDQHREQDGPLAAVGGFDLGLAGPPLRPDHARGPEPDEQDRHEHQIQQIGEALRGEVVLADPAAEHEDPDAGPLGPPARPHVPYEQEHRYQIEELDRRRPPADDLGEVRDPAGLRHERGHREEARPAPAGVQIGHRGAGPVDVVDEPEVLPGRREPRLGLDHGGQRVQRDTRSPPA